MRDEIFDRNIEQRILEVVVIDVDNFLEQLFQVLFSSRREHGRIVLILACIRNKRICRIIYLKTRANLIKL